MRSWASKNSCGGDRLHLGDRAVRERLLDAQRVELGADQPRQIDAWSAPPCGVMSEPSVGTRMRLNIERLLRCRPHRSAAGRRKVRALASRGVEPRRPASSAARHRPRRVGRPFAPRSRIEHRAGQPGVLHREQVVAGGDAGAALVHDARRRRRAEQRLELRTQRAAGLKRPSASRLALKNRFIAPGMWPATGSSGSTSPRKRSGARASRAGACRAVQRAAAPIDRHRGARAG